MNAAGVFSVASGSQALVTPVGSSSVNISIQRSVGAFGSVTLFWNLDNACSAANAVIPAFGSLLFFNNQTASVRFSTLVEFRSLLCPDRALFSLVSLQTILVTVPNNQVPSLQQVCLVSIIAVSNQNPLIDGVPIFVQNSSTAALTIPENKFVHVSIMPGL